MRKPGNIKHPVSARTGKSAISANRKDLGRDLQKGVVVGPPPANPKSGMGATKKSGTQYTQGTPVGTAVNK